VVAVVTSVGVVVAVSSPLLSLLMMRVCNDGTCHKVRVRRLHLCAMLWSLTWSLPLRRRCRLRDVVRRLATGSPFVGGLAVRRRLQH